MITEDYVSFETAKLLKEKGFDGPCHKVWGTHGDSQTLIRAPWFVEGETVVNRESVDAAAKQYTYDLDNKVEGYLAPTPQMAMKWLREVHKIEVRVIYDNDKSSWYGACNPMRESSQILLGFGRKSKSYEEACEAAIKYCLEKLV